MNDIHDPARDWDTRVENFAAELTSAVYPLVLRRGLRDSWLKVELGLWRALADTVQQWTRRRPTAEAAQELEVWREGLLVDLTASALHIALQNWPQGSPAELQRRLSRALRLATRRHRRASNSE